MQTRQKRRKFIARILSLVMFLFLITVVGLSLFLYSKKEMRVNSVISKKVDVTKGIKGDVSINDFKVDVLKKLDHSINRPIFMSSRLPYVAEITKDEPKEDDILEPVSPLQEVMQSIIITDKYRVVFLKGAEGTIRLEEGMSYNEWTIDKINKDSVEMSSNGQVNIVELRTFATSEPTETITIGGDENNGTNNEKK